MARMRTETVLPKSPLPRVGAAVVARTEGVIALSGFPTHSIEPADVREVAENAWSGFARGKVDLLIDRIVVNAPRARGASAMVSFSINASAREAKPANFDRFAESLAAAITDHRLRSGRIRAQYTPAVSASNEDMVRALADGVGV